MVLENRRHLIFFSYYSTVLKMLMKLLWFIGTKLEMAQSGYHVQSSVFPLLSHIPMARNHLMVFMHRAKPSASLCPYFYSLVNGCI